MMKIRWENSAYLPYYLKIYKYRKIFERKIAKIRKASNVVEKISLANDAATYATFYPSGYYSSHELENVYLEVAKQLPDIQCYPNKNSVLHILTTAYTVGGHTRVVERWINSSPQEERHSVILLNQGNNECPTWLKEAAKNHDGDFIILDSSDLRNKALKLRQIAAYYERIILHIHMNDGTAIIAFGVSSFTNPVYLFNHADHLFWLGVSVADVVADIRHNDISAIYRGVTGRSVFLGVPPDSIGEELKSIKQLSKKTVREELNIPQEAFVIVSTASAHKYKRSGRLHIKRLLYSINKKYENVLTYLIGPDMKNDNEWKQVYEQSNQKVIPLGNLSDKKLYYKYLLAADLYMGSYPTGSFTAMMDGVQIGLPCVQLCIIKQNASTYAIDTMEKESLCWCYSERDFIRSVSLAITDKSFYRQLLKDSQRWLNEYADMQGWLKRKNNMYNFVSVHKVYPFKEQVVLNDMFAQNLFFVMSDLRNRDYSNCLIRKLSHLWLYWHIK